MEFRSKLKNMKVLVVGLGKSGKAAVKVLLDLGCRVSVQDSAAPEQMDREYLEYLEANTEAVCLGRTPDESSGFDLVVVSPGVPPTLDFIRREEEKGAEVIGELELAYRLTDASFVAITGTNGKTTTTTLVGDIFRKAGRKTSVVGNIGVPVINAAETAGADEWMVTEASSFQLETTELFEPKVSAILNLTPDHLNRHKTMKAYGEAKARIAINQNDSEYLVINLDDSEAYALAAGMKAKTVPFSRSVRLETGAFLDGDSIIVRDFDGREFKLCDRDELRIIGDHNVENVLAAAAVAYVSGIEPQVISEAIREFPGVEHRIEFCGSRNGVDYYNDSKGTNVDAAVIALKALKENIILIAGGDGKAQDFTELAARLKGPVDALILLGRDADIIETAARSQGFDRIYTCRDMEECVNKAAELAGEGSRVLLSPACASWDMYDNFEQRGRHFKECVRKLIEG